MSEWPPSKFGYCTCAHSYWSHVVTILPHIGLRNVCERVGCRCIDFARNPES